jgi:hypothetical protein
MARRVSRPVSKTRGGVGAPAVRVIAKENDAAAIEKTGGNCESVREELCAPHRW